MNFPRQRDSPRSSSSWISFDVNVINLSKSLKMYRYILLLGVLKRVNISLPALTDVTKDSLQFESKFCKTREMSTSVQTCGSPPTNSLRSSSSAKISDVSMDSAIVSTIFCL